ncbi:MAG: hypothetical protein ACI4LA_05700 [Emergencia sp.]
MKKKRTLAVLLSLVMVFAAFQTAVYAWSPEDMKNQPNAMAVVTVASEDCTVLPEVGDLSVTLSSAEAGIDITVPVQKIDDADGLVTMWLGVPEERISDAVMKKLDEIQGKIDLGAYADSPEKFLEEADGLLSGFTVRVNGLPEGHYVTGGSAVVITNEIYRQAVDMLRQILEEEVGQFDTFSGLIQQFLDDAGLTLDEIFDTSDMTAEDWEELAAAGITQETLDAIKDLILNIDAVIEYMCSEDFTGVLIAGAVLSCDCPEIMSYQIQHRYYEKVNGKTKLVSVVYEGEYSDLAETWFMSGAAGDVIRGADFRNDTYKGRTYTYMGSYDSTVIYDDFKWSQYEMDSFVLGGDDNIFGLVLRYVYDKEGAAASGGSEDGSDSGDGSVPATGDSKPIGMYILLLVTAVAATGAVAAYRRNRK